MRIAAMMVVASLALTSACSGTASVKQARGEVDVFHRQLDREDYEAVWRGSSEDITKAGNKAPLVGLLSAIHAKLGKVKDTKQVGWKVDYANGVSTAELTMQTTFEKGAAEEHFVYRGAKEGLKLAGYHIDPK